MRDKQLPKAVLELLSKNGIDKDDILASSQTDMNTECEYADGFVIVSSKLLAIITSPPVLDGIRSFKGFVSKKDVADSYINERDDWAIRIYAIESVTKLEIRNLVACAVLIGTIDDIDYRLSAFSNMYRKSMHKVSRTFDRIHDPKPEFSEENKGSFGGDGGPFGGDRDKEDDEFCPICGMMYPDRNRKVCPKCMDRKSVFIRTLSFFKPYAWKIGLMFVCYVLMALIGLIWPYLNGTVLYDSVLAKNDKFIAALPFAHGEYVIALLMVVGGMFLAKLLSLLIQILQGVLTAKVVPSVVCTIKQRVFERMSQLSIGFFKSKQTGHLMTRVLSDAEEVTGFFIDGLPYLFIHGLSLAAMVAMIFSIRWQMGIIAVVMVPILIIIGFRLRPILFNLYGHYHRARRRVNSRVNDNLTGARVVKAFGRERDENDRFGHDNIRFREADMAIAGFRVIYRVVYDCTYRILMIVVWILGVRYVLVTGSMEIGVLMTVVGYIGQMQGPVGFFSRISHWWAESMNSAQRIFEILDSVPDLLEAEEPKKLTAPEGHIELDKVTFGYEINRPVLKDISLDIPAGSMLGIVGRSGAGKTTLVNLISRMYDPQEGSIRIDGVDVKEIAFRDLRRNVAMVSQETYIFRGTVIENIAYAKPGATSEEIINAARLASAHEFIMRMPDGYDTRIGSGGRDLSGGERQRISIARAILANPKILILDEATAAVDTETERSIQMSLRYLVKGRTTISIAHRLSTLRDADFLVVIDNGEITEQGTADELLKLKGTYYKLMELQTKALALRE